MYLSPICSEIIRISGIGGSVDGPRTNRSRPGSRPITGPAGAIWTTCAADCTPRSPGAGCTYSFFGQCAGAVIVTSWFGSGATSSGGRFAEKQWRTSQVLEVQTDGTLIARTHVSSLVIIEPWVMWWGMVCGALKML
jgi:hypothetical protein